VYTVTCPASGLSAVVACACDQVGHDALATGAHHERCQMSNITSNLRCPPAFGCCQKDHDHEAAANACPGGHGDCPEPDTCRLWGSVLAHNTAMRQAYKEHQATGSNTVHVAEMLKTAPAACPGGHCHKDIDGCTVCHPVIITAGQGTAVLRPVTA
jgi:hypothetical protein